jgi:hypothetical protein
MAPNNARRLSTIEWLRLPLIHPTGDGCQIGRRPLLCATSKDGTNCASTIKLKTRTSSLGSEPVGANHDPGNRVRTRLAAGGRWIRTSGSWSRGGQTVMRDCLENRSGSVGEPKVRIHLPPAKSLRTIGSAVWESTRSARTRGSRLLPILENLACAARRSDAAASAAQGQWWFQPSPRMKEFGPAGGNFKFDNGRWRAAVKRIGRLAPQRLQNFSYT